MTFKRCVYGSFCILLFCLLVFAVGRCCTPPDLTKDTTELRVESELLRKDISDLQLHLDRIGEEVALLERIYAVAQCESGLQHDGCWGDNGRAYGILQFHEPTFAWLCQLSGIQGDWMNREDQLRVGMWAFSHGYDYLWTCSKTVERRVKFDDYNGCKDDGQDDTEPGPGKENHQGGVV